MPYKEKATEKFHYSIGEVAKILGVNTSLIRYWEQEFDLIRPKKTARGTRVFTKKDLKNLQLIYHLVKERGYTHDGARKKLKQNPASLHQEQTIIEKLNVIKSFLLELKEGVS